MAKVQLFDPSQMLPGDIVFERGDTLGGKVVAGITKGPYSHVLIWVGGDNFVEAMPDGVRALSYARVPVAEPGNWRLLRPKAEHRAVGVEAAVHARAQVFKSYDAIGAGRSIGPARKRAVSKARFCSQLVAEAYLQAGLDLLPGRSPETIKPNDLLAIETHEDLPLPLISSEVLGGDYPKAFLNRSKAFKSSNMRREAKTAQQIFKAMEPKVRRLTLPAGYQRARPGNLAELLELLPYLPSLSGRALADDLRIAMHTRKYFDQLKPELARIWAEWADEDDKRQHVAGWIESRDFHHQNQLACRQYNMHMPHALWRDLEGMYRDHVLGFNALIHRASAAPKS